MIRKLQQILLLSSDPQIYTLIQNYLAKESPTLQIYPCHTGRDGEQQLSLESYDLLLLDHHLSDMTGLEFYEHLQKNGLDLATIFMTKPGFEAVINQAFGLGLTTYLIRDDAQGYLKLLPGLIQTTHRNSHNLVKESQRRAKAEALQQATLSFTLAQTLPEVLDKILSHAQQFVSYDSTAIFLLKGNVLQVVAGYGFPEPEKIIGRTLPLAESIFFKEFQRTGTPMILADLQTDSRFNHWGDADYIHGWMAIPMFIRGSYIGHVTFDNKIVGAYNDYDVTVAQMFVDQAAIAIENAQLFEETQRHLQQLTTLNILAHEMAGLLDVESLCSVVAQHIHDTFGYLNVAIFVVSPEKRHLTLQAITGTYDDSIQAGQYQWEFGQGLMGQVVATEQAVVANDIHHYADFIPQPSVTICSEAAIPLKSGTQLIGVLNVDSDRYNAFDDSDVATLTAVADQLAVALEKAWLFEEIEEKAEQLEILRQATLGLTSTMELHSVLETVIENVLIFLPNIYNAYIFLYENEILNLGVAWENGYKPQAQFPPRQDGLTAAVARQGTSIVVPDLTKHPLFSDNPEWRGSIIGQPLKIGPRVVGVMNIAFSEPHIWLDSELHVISLLADQAAIAIENAHLYREQHASRREAEALHRTALVLVSTVNPDEVIKHILTELQPVVPYDSASVQLLQGDYIEIIDGQGFTNLNQIIGHRFPLADEQITRLNKQVIESQTPVIIADTAAYPEQFFKEPHVQTQIQSWMGVPMFIGPEVLGMITLDKQQKEFYTERHAYLAKAYAAQAAIAIQNARLFSQAQQEIKERIRTETELKQYKDRLEDLVEERTIALRAASAEATEARDKIDAILQSVADGLIVTDLNHQIILANPAAETLLNFQEQLSPETGLATTIKHGWLRDLVHSSLRHQITDCDIEVKLQDEARKQTRIMHARTSLVDDQDQNIVGAVTIVRDVTRLREIDRLKTEFLSIAAHELRTPLTTILGFSELMLSRSYDEARQKHYLSMINEQATHLSEIVNNLLDISRLEAGQGLEINLERVDMGAVLQHIAQPFIASAPNHHFHFENLTNLPLIVGDSTRLGQVGKNLFSNAIKYSPNGGNITVGCRVLTSCIEFRIQDEGIGLTSEQQAHLFERFYRADTSNTAIGSTGLGLAVSKLIIDLHGGEIWVKSKEDVGTTIYFTLPTVNTNSKDL